MNSLEPENIEAADRSDYLARYHGWLRLMARLQLDSRWDCKFDASDILQQTLLEAWKGESGFDGNTSGERIAWLRTILGRVIGREVRKYDGTQRRDPGKELSLQRSIDQSSILLENVLAAETDSPSIHADNREQQTIIADELESLPKDYREVIVLRNLRGLSHAEIATRLERTESAVRMLWLRALKELQTRVLARQ